MKKNVNGKHIDRKGLGDRGGCQRQSGGKGRNPAGARVASAGEREGAAGVDLRPPGALPTAHGEQVED